MISFLYHCVHRLSVPIMLFLCLLMATDASGGSYRFPHSVQFIYIDANIGNSSGGHTALRLGDMVYHFQLFPDGFFRIVRDRWSYFRYIYNDLENRTLNLAHISVSANVLDRNLREDPVVMAELVARSRRTYLDIRRESFTKPSKFKNKSFKK